mmetsp:Transcript_16679/g.31028  ORF Transcript_16679/g.31028 Transcript_16679/m.31028 type:complete len:167 (+) Transcript_16679:2-502(+)
MLGLAYYPLLLWLPMLALQAGTSMKLGRGMQAALRGVTYCVIETPLCYFLKIVWVVMFVLALDCMRIAVSVTADTSGLSQRAFEAVAAKEGALVLVVNMVAMVAIYVVHYLTKEVAKLETDRDMMKRQAQQAGEFAKQLLTSDSPKKTAEQGVPPESKMPEKASEK